MIMEERRPPSMHRGVRTSIHPLLDSRRLHSLAGGASCYAPAISSDAKSIQVIDRESKGDFASAVPRLRGEWLLGSLADDELQRAVRFCSVRALTGNTELPVRRTFGNRSAAAVLSRWRDLKKAATEQHRRILVRHRFGRGATVRVPAKPPLRFFGLRAPEARVSWTLNPLVVGSIPTRPTNYNKGLA